MLCNNCNNETSNPKFCSRSCAAIYNNKHYPKRKTKKRCLVCNEPVDNYRQSRCTTHKNEYLESKVKSLTVGQCRSLPSILGKHPFWVNVRIRQYGRDWNKHLQNLPCASCGYNKHVEICHRIPVSSFSDDTLLVVVNAPNNLIQLCPNCHWEFDHGLLSI